MFIEARGVTKFYKGRCILKDLSFGIGKGESVRVDGKNGSGKSTLMGILAGKLPCESGLVLIGQTEASKSHRTVLLPQKYSMVAHMTLSTNLSLPLILRGFRKRDALAVAKEQLKLFGIERFCDYYPGQLSGGIIRRAAIAETCLFEADVLLLDEPFCGIDTESRYFIIHYLNYLRIQGKTLVIVSHDTDAAEYITERTLYIENGSLYSFSAEDEIGVVAV